jgi:uncharacterized protein (DUF2132 family)
MNDEINYKSNPLHGVSLKAMLTELVEHYGFEILYAYLGINCFKTNPSIASSVKFLNKTDWARENLENFYLYQFKSLPRASAEQYALSPRDRLQHSVSRMPSDCARSGRQKRQTFARDHAGIIPRRVAAVRTRRKISGRMRAVRTRLKLKVPLCGEMPIPGANARPEPQFSVFHARPSALPSDDAATQ